MHRLARLKQHAAAAWEVPRDLLLRRYPPFVTGGALPVGQIPVFCFHSLEPLSFERKLRHLADNHYVTLSADEYYAVLTGQRSAPERAVVLTFDDGRSSVRTIGYPLLQRFGMKGIVFVVPGRTQSRPGPLPPTLADVPARTDVPALLAREAGGEAFLSWEELESLARTGLLDFQSHSLSHARVHVAPRVTGFMHPALRTGYGPLDAPLVHSEGRDLFAPDVPLGTPLLHDAPRLSEATRFYEDPQIRPACVALVHEQGGAAFFERPDWEARLRRLVTARAPSGRQETWEERERALREELAGAQRLLAERLGRPARDLCYPWHVSGPTAQRLAHEAGYRTAWCGKVRGVPITPVGGNPFQIARIGEDYVELLPGRGRGRLAEVLKAKFGRRFAAARAAE